MNTILLVDGYSIMYRSHFAYAGRAMLTAPDGTPTGAISGFFNTLFSVTDEYKPSHVCVLFDVHKPTFRHELSSEYKATRKPMPDELRVEIPLLKSILDLMGIAHLEKERFEADDLIGTLSLKASENGDRVLILSGDHDDFQLIDENVSVVLPQSGKGKPPRILFTEELFTETYGVSPKSFVYVKALMGDNSDNIKGINKVGEKTAFKLIADYNDIDNLYAHIDDIKGALRANLEGQEDFLKLNLELCTIDRHVDIKYDFSDMVLDFEKMSSSQELCNELNRLMLKGVLKKLKMDKMKAEVILSDSDDDSDLISSYSALISEAADKGLNLVAIDDLSKFEAFVDSISFSDDYPYFSVLFSETSPSLLAVSAFGSNDVYYADISLSDKVFDVLLKKNTGRLISSFSYKNRSKTLSFAISGLSSVFDTEISSYVLNVVSGSNVSFRNVFERTLRMNYPFEDKKSGQIDMLSLLGGASDDDLNVRDLCNDCWLNTFAARIQAESIDKQNLNKLMYEIEFPLVITLDNIERNGMHISIERLKELHEDFTRRIKVLEQKIYEITGEEFLISSPKQLSYILFDKLGLKHGKKGKTGYYSTSAEVLNQLREDSPVIDLILEYRQISKLDSTYTLGLIDKADENGRVHTTFTQAMTNTGRLSSTEPNLQNIPVRSEEGSKIREAFTAPSGRVLVDSDYSQIELRLLAEMSGDENMVHAFTNDEDIHTRTASELFGCKESEVNSRMRAIAKTVNFSIIYGITEYGLSQDLSISYADAKTLIEGYSVKFPAVMSYLDGLKKKGIELLYSETMFGRRRYLNELSSANRNIKEFGLRAAMNTPIQGTAADIIKIAMNRVNNALKEKLPTAKLVMQVHDELIVECDRDDAYLCSQILKNEMEASVSMKVPLVADCNIGADWLEAK